MNKIKRVSFIFRMVFQVIFFVLPLLVAVSWAYAPQPFVLFDNIVHLDAIPTFYSHRLMHTLNLTEKILGFCLDAVFLSIHLFILYCLIKLFRLYEQGEIFSLSHVKYIRNIGYGLLCGQLWNPVYQFLMGLVLTMRNPHGYRVAGVTLDQTNVGILLTALLVILISWIVAEGCKLHEEQQLTI